MEIGARLRKRWYLVILAAIIALLVGATAVAKIGHKGLKVNRSVYRVGIGQLLVDTNPSTLTNITAGSGALGGRGALIAQYSTRPQVVDQIAKLAGVSPASLTLQAQTTSRHQDRRLVVQEPGHPRRRHRVGAAAHGRSEPDDHDHQPGAHRRPGQVTRVSNDPRDDPLASATAELPALQPSDAGHHEHYHQLDLRRNHLRGQAPVRARPARARRRPPRPVGRQGSRARAGRSRARRRGRSSSQSSCCAGSARSASPRSSSARASRRRSVTRSAHSSCCCC